MPETKFEKRLYTSKVDGYEDYYFNRISRRSRPQGRWLCFFIQGSCHAEQAFCDSYNWCFYNLGSEIKRRNGVYLSPEYRGDSWLNAAAEADVLDIIQDVKKQFGTRKVVLAGISMGGTAALICASHNPELITGVIAICPATDMRKLYQDLISSEELIYRKIADYIRKAYGGAPDALPDEYDYRSSINFSDRLAMPIVLRHGDNDKIISVSHSRALESRLRERGAPIVYEEIYGGDHEAAVIGVPWRDYLDFVLARQEL